MSTVDKDQVIAYLLQKNRAMERVLDQIDRDVREATDRYISEWKPAFPGQKLTFARFLGLLVEETTKKLRIKSDEKEVRALRRELEVQVLKEFEDRLTHQIVGDTLHVVVLFERLKPADIKTGMGAKPVYKAFCLERMITAEAETPEAACARWRHKAMCKLSIGPITRFPYPDDGSLARSFAGGTLIQESKIGQYTVIVRGFFADRLTAETKEIA